MITIAVAGVREIIHGLLFFLVIVCCVSGIYWPDAAIAQKPGDDLFESPYVYLLWGDENFNKLAPNYSYTVPTPDSAFKAENRPLPGKKSDTVSDTARFFGITLDRPMSVRMIFADSTGTGLAVFDFPRIPAGEYTLGAKTWPEKLRGLISGRNAINVYFVADTKYQSRFLFDVGLEGQLLRTVRTQFRKK